MDNWLHLMVIVLSKTKKEHALKREDICKDFIVWVNTQGIGFSRMLRIQWRK